MPFESRDQIERRYSDLIGHLKACWAFQQFLRRIARQLPEAIEGPTEVDFGEVFDQLKEMGHEVGSGDSAALAETLDGLEGALRAGAAELRRQDSRVGPSDLRRFLGRVRRLDEDLLLGLLRFQVFAARGHRWDSDLVDKVDFLLSRLGEEIAGPLLSQDRVRLSASLATLWAASGVVPPTRPVAGALGTQIAEIEHELEEVASLEELEERALVRRYRKLKHGLGPLLVEPSIAQAILRTNARLSRLVQKFYDEEEWHLAAGFSRVAQAQQGAALSEALSLEVESLRLDMERLEEGRRYDDVRIASVRRIREHADTIFPQVEPPAVESVPAGPLEAFMDTSPSEVAESDGASVPALTTEELGRELLEKLFSQLEALLAATESVYEAEAALQDPGLPFGLERREIQAFLLVRDQAGATDEDRMLLSACALRLRLKMLRDYLEAGDEKEIVDEAEVALRLGEELLSEFSERIEDAVESGAEFDARELQFLRVMLMRDFSFLWLEIHGAP